MVGARSHARDAQGLVNHLRPAGWQKSIRAQKQPFLVRQLGVKERHEEKAERNVRLKLAHAALAQLEKVAEESPRSANVLRQVNAHHQERIEALDDELAEVLGWSDHREHLIATRRLQLEGLEAERRELIKLRRDHQADEELMPHIDRELDSEEARLRA